MKKLITYLKALWSWVSGSQRKKIGVTLGEATIEHPFSTYSAPFGTCWQPSGKLHSVVRCAAMLVMLFTIGSGNAWGQSTTYTSNVTFTAGTNGSDCKVIVTGSTQYNGVKLGTDSKTGTMTFTVPAGTTTIHIHAAGWNGDGNSRTLNISTSRGTLASGSTSMALTNDAGVKNNTPFTLNTPANASTSYYKSLSISGVTGGTATITITTSSKRAVVWGVNAVVPSCTTNPIVMAGSNSSVTATTATVSCSSGISSLGSAGCSITDYGFVIGTSDNPTIGGSGVTKHQVGTTYTSTGASFSKDLTGLSAETTYYVRPYATNGNGTAYGTQTSFTTSALPTYTVTLKDNDEALAQASAGASVTLPSRDGCDGYTFVGWTKTWSVAQTTWTTTAPTIIPDGSYTPTDNENLYPVYTKTEGGEEEETEIFATTSLGSTNTVTTGYAVSAVAEAKSGYYQDGSGTTRSVSVRKSSTATAMISSIPTIATVTAKLGGGTTRDPLTNNVYAVWLDASGNELGDAVQITSKITNTTGSDFTANLPVANATSAYGVRIKHQKETSYNVRYYAISLSIITGGSTTYYISVPDCGDPCEQLGAAKGLTVVTDFVQDGQTYVKFSWTPAAPSKEGTTQKLCYGLVGQEKTCTVSAKDLGEAKGVASNLPAGEYEWSIQAIGDGNNYCDGDEVEGTNFYIYSITYNTNGGNTIAATSGTTLPDPLPTPTREHYNFKGWYTNSELTIAATAGAAITQNTTLYAKWTAKTYTITLDANGGTFVDNRDSQTKGSATFDYIYGTYATYSDAPNLTEYYTDLKRDGYQFDGWVSAGSPWNKLFTNTVDRTIQAQWSKLYSITLSENGTTTELTPQTSTSYTLPDELTAGSCQDDTKELVGWSTVAIPDPGDKPTSNFYELGETVTLTADQTTFYAVFATAEGAGFSIGQSGTFKIYANVSGTNYYAQGCVDDKKIIATNSVSDASDYTLTYTDGAYTIKQGTNNIGHSSKTDLSTDETTWTISEGTKGSWRVSSNIDNARALSYSTSASAFKAYAISNITADGTTYYDLEIGGGTTYSDYTTSCVALPDPVISFVTTPADPIVFDPVNCGSTTSKAQAKTVQVSGENLRDVVNVSVTGPYKIARTTSTALKDFTTSLTLDKTAEGAIHSNYQTVYIISTPPAQSTEATTGTLTFTTTKGNTLTVNLSTPTVTCTQYTLTLVDRGVSTEQPTKYYAGETINEAPADPEGVCTDPIHYVFDGWAAATVAAGSITYTKVSFPYTMPAKATTLYAVYRYTEGNIDSDKFMSVNKEIGELVNGMDYVLTGYNTYDGKEYALSCTQDESGKYKTKQIDVSESTTMYDEENPYYELTTTDNEIIWTITGDDENGYSFQNKSTGKYLNMEESSLVLNDNNPTKYTIDHYEEYDNELGDYVTYLNMIIQPLEDYSYYLSSYYKNSTAGVLFNLHSSSTLQLYLYKRAAATLYTTSPACGPMLEITSGKDIYVTSGYGTGRNTVIAQQTVEYRATRLKTQNGSAEGKAPDVKVAANGITIGGEVTDKVKVVELTQNKVLIEDKYTITGTVTVQYTPTANNLQEEIQVQLAVDYNSEAKDNFTVHARSLPAEFVIAAKQGEQWYALNADMSGSDAEKANNYLQVDNIEDPTKATFAPCNTIYTFDGMVDGGNKEYMRFQGIEGKYLWAASEGNTGIQNYAKNTPTAVTTLYNWQLYTNDNETYQLQNEGNGRKLGLNKDLSFGMYSPVSTLQQDIRILPIEAKCIYNYAPTNLKVSVLKGSYVTLTWDAVIGATKYQYSTDATSWTDAGTDPTVTINGLTGDNEYTYYIRAYHEDAGVTQECIDYAEITFTTANCDDVPTDITYSADMNSIIVSWIANAATSTVNLYLDEEAEVLVATQSVASPCTFTDLAKNTQYYVQILADGTCASPIVPVKTEDVEVDIVEWLTDGIIVDINTDETVGVTLENEVSYGSGMGTEATELFFSKYYEASYNVKLVAIYNGTKNIIDLTDYTIQYGKTSWESDYITLKDFGATKGQIQPGEEIILYTMQEGSEDDNIMNCVHEDFPDGNWVEVTSSNNDGKGKLSFGGDKTIILCKKEYDDEKDEYYDNIIDVIGALKNDPNEGILPTNEETEKPSWGDANGWTCATGLSIEDDTEIGISTNRCLLIRNNTVTSGDNAVTQNIDDFVTLCTEWKGAHVPENDIDNGVRASCDNFAYVGTFDYSDYYTKYETMGEGTTFDENDRNPDGTVTIPITDLYKHACSNIRVKLTNSNSEVLSDREYKVPIMITTDQETAYTDENKNQNAFYALQQNLATKEVDGEGNVTATHPLSLAEVREICKTCDVVVRDNATLTKVTDGTDNDHPQVRNVYVYEGASIVIPDGENHNYTINGLSLRRKGDEVASAQVQGTGKFVLPADEPVCLDLRVDANNWHWFTLPYDCDIADVTWIDGTPAKYNTDWFLMYYDGESRAASTNPHDNHWKVYSGTTIEAGKGYIVGITGDLTHPNYTFELRFPMAQEVLTAEQTDKTVPVNAWGVQSDNTPNNLGWNLVGNPYLNYYKTADGYSLAGLPLIHYTHTDPVTGEWNYVYSGGVPYVATPIDGGWYEYRQELASEVNLMPFTAYFVQVGDPETHTNGQALNASFEANNRGKKSIVRRAPREVEEIEEPIIVRVELTNSKGESDKTSLVIDDRFTNEYEMNGDFFKWFGDYYNYYTKPVLYTIGADQGKRAFNALNEELAKQPIPMGMYAAQAGNYTFSLNQQFDLSRVEEVWLYDATQSTYTNLMQSDYTFSTSKVNGAGRFSLSVKLAPKVATSIDNVTADKVWATTHTKQVIVNGLDSSMHLWLYDATGKLLYNEPTSNYQHTYSVPQTGTYFVSVMKGNAKQTIKVVVE